LPQNGIASESPKAAVLASLYTNGLKGGTTMKVMWLHAYNSSRTVFVSKLY